MANEQNLKPWPKGVSGNAAGYSRGRRISDAVERWLDENPENEHDILIAVVAMATGKRRLLADDLEEDKVRKPDLAWFMELRELIQPKANDKNTSPEPTDQPPATNADGISTEP